MQEKKWQRRSDLLLESRRVRVTGIGIHVVNKRQMVRDITSPPATEERIQQSLVSTC